MNSINTFIEKGDSSQGSDHSELEEVVRQRVKENKREIEHEQKQLPSDISRDTEISTGDMFDRYDEYTVDGLNECANELAGEKTGV